MFRRPRLAPALLLLLCCVIAGPALFDRGIAVAQDVEDDADTQLDLEAGSGDDGRIVVAMTEIEPFVFNDDGDPDGLYVEIWHELAAEVGLEYDVVWADSFVSMLELVEGGEAQVAVAPLAPTAEREARLDFTSAVISSGPLLGYHERLGSARPNILDAITSWRVMRILLFALAGLVVLAHIIWIVERHDQKGMRDISSSYVQGIWDSFWWAMVTVTTVGYGDTVPRSVRGRLVALVAMLISLFLVGALVSQTSTILAEEAAVAVSGLDDLDGRAVGVVGGTSFANYLAGREVNVVEFASQEELFAGASDGAVDLVVANIYAINYLGPRFDVQATGEVFYEEFETFGLPQGSPLREILNQGLADLQASGEVGDIVNRWSQ